MKEQLYGSSCWQASWNTAFVLQLETGCYTWTCYHICFLFLFFLVICSILNQMKWLFQWLNEQKITSQQLHRSLFWLWEGTVCVSLLLMEHHGIQCSLETKAGLTHGWGTITMQRIQGLLMVWEVVALHSDFWGWDTSLLRLWMSYKGTTLKVLYGHGDWTGTYKICRGFRMHGSTPSVPLHVLFLSLLSLKKKI